VTIPDGIPSQALAFWYAHRIKLLGQRIKPLEFSRLVVGVIVQYKLDAQNTLCVRNREEWRVWLKEHYKSKREVWLVYHKKHTRKTRIPYNDAVEEALCFGWIDSTVKSIDEDRFAQRFSVRNPMTPYSQANKERLRVLVNQGRVIDEVLATLGNLVAEEFEIPGDIIEAIKASKQAWENFQRFSQSYVRIRIAFVDGARNRPEEFKKRLNYFIKMSEKNRQFGYGGIEKYY
jgi:uncharacterized protein YdeI (YjbR/CyaY-like superfamily)